MVMMVLLAGDGNLRGRDGPAAASFAREVKPARLDLTCGVEYKFEGEGRFTSYEFLGKNN
jgi:hypothetical protein